MIDFPRNENVRTIGDVKHVITSVIFRQRQDFSKEDIYEAVEKNLERSDFAKDGAKRNEIDVRKMVDNTFNQLFSWGSIRYGSKEKYYQLDMSWPAV